MPRGSFFHGTHALKTPKCTKKSTDALENAVDNFAVSNKNTEVSDAFFCFTAVFFHKNRVSLLTYLVTTERAGCRDALIGCQEVYTFYQTCCRPCVACAEMRAV